MGKSQSFNLRVMTEPELEWLGDRCENYMTKLLDQMSENAQVLSHEQMSHLKKRYERVQAYLDNRLAAHNLAKRFKETKAELGKTGGRQSTFGFNLQGPRYGSF